MIKVKIGKGCCHRLGWKNSFTFGMDALLEKRHLDLTLEQFAKIIAKKYKVKDGRITLATIRFQVEKREGKLKKGE